MTGFTNPPSLICIAPFARMELRYQNGCTFEGEEKTITTALDNFSGIRYDIYLKWNHLDSLITKTFSSSGTDSVTEITYYRYDNPEHALPTLTRITDSKNDTIENQCYYPQDYSNSFNDLVDKHIIGVPVDQRKIMDGILTSGTLFHYDSFGNITGIDKAENELGTSVGFSNGNPFSYGTRKTNLSYDQDGCLNAVKNLDDIEINYLWGYRSQYPIAEISGSAIAEINNILIQGGFSVSILKHSLDDSYINSATIYLRNNLPNALVVSYTYDPQIGITSKTEANGMKSYFVYNSNGKLSEIKDSNGKIIRKFNYHYASN